VISTLSRPVLRLLLLAGVLVLVPGCLNVTLAHVTRGNPIDRNRVTKLTPGRSTLADVLSVLGAPIEVHAHPEGRLLIYRHRARNLFEFGIDAGTLTRFYDVPQITSSLLGNIKFTLQRVHVDEDRLVVLFDRNHILVGIGFRDRTDKLPVF
jgi:hypothetical protein